MQNVMRGTIFFFNYLNFQKLVKKIDQGFERDDWKPFSEHQFSNYDKEKIGTYLKENPLSSILDDEDEPIKIETFIVEKTFKMAPLPFTLYLEIDSRLKDYLSMFSLEMLQQKLFNSTFLATVNYFCRAYLNLWGKGL